VTLHKTRPSASSALPSPDPDLSFRACTTVRIKKCTNQ
jgi:hypothetical protein